MKQTLWIDLRAGLSGERLAAALIGLGVPEREMMQVMKTAVPPPTLLDAHTHLQFLPDETVARQLHIAPLGEQEPLAWEDAPAVLDEALGRTAVHPPYADFAHQALSILRAAESHINQPAPAAAAQTPPLPIIGVARTPYKHKAPYQPQPENTADGSFYIQIAPQYAAAMQALESFSHIFVLSYLNKALEPELSVRPPWKDSAERYGVFATRSPNRPSPIGLTRVRLRKIEGNRIYTGPLDLFDGTPILDIKPFIRTLDSMDDEEEASNDGWLEGSDHLELHRLGIPHTHPGGGSLHHPQTLIALLVGIAWGLQRLEINLASVIGLTPFNTGPEHALEPTAQTILAQHKIPYQAEGPDDSITPDGAAILAALSPTFAATVDFSSANHRAGLGLGSQILPAAPAFGALRLFFMMEKYHVIHPEKHDDSA